MLLGSYEYVFTALFNPLTRCPQRLRTRLQVYRSCWGGVRRGVRGNHGAGSLLRERQHPAADGEGGASEDHHVLGERSLASGVPPCGFEPALSLSVPIPRREQPSSPGFDPSRLVVDFAKRYLPWVENGHTLAIVTANLPTPDLSPGRRSIVKCSHSPCLSPPGNLKSHRRSPSTALEA